MPTIARTNRATLSHIVDIALNTDEQTTTTGDRLRGSADRRPARVVGYHLRFEWNDNTQRWNLQGWESTAYVQQQRQDNTWGDPRNRRIDYDDRDALEQQYAPDTTPAVTW